MDDEKFNTFLKDTLNTACGFLFVSELLERLGAYERGCNFDNPNIEYYNRGKREKGLWLLDLVKKVNFEKYEQIQKNRR